MVGSQPWWGFKSIGKHQVVAVSSRTLPLSSLFPPASEEVVQAICLFGLWFKKITVQMPVLPRTQTHRSEKVAARILKVVMQALSSSHQVVLPTQRSALREATQLDSATCLQSGLQENIQKVAAVENSVTSVKLTKPLFLRTAESCQRKASVWDLYKEFSEVRVSGIQQVSPQDLFFY